MNRELKILRQAATTCTFSSDFHFRNEKVRRQLCFLQTFFIFLKCSGADEETSDHTIDEDEAHFQAEAEQAKRARAAFLEKPSHAD